MGKGDKKSRKGKISMGSYGVTRPRNKKKTVVTTSKTKKVKPVDKTEEDAAKTAPKKVAAKKAAPKKAAKKTEE